MTDHAMLQMFLKDMAELEFRKGLYVLVRYYHHKPPRLLQYNCTLQEVKDHCKSENSFLTPNDFHETTEEDMQHLYCDGYFQQ